jgi:hypothetical protein
MKRVKYLLASLLVLGTMLVTPMAMLGGTALAQSAGASCQEPATSFFGLPTWYKYLSFSGDCDIEFDMQQDIPKVALALFEIILRLGGLVAVGFVIYGGFQYILSQGEPDRLKGARGTIINALIGLAITISATVIVNLVAGSIL